MDGRLGGDGSMAPKEVESSPRGRQEAARDQAQQELGKPASSGRRGQQSWRPHPFLPWGPGPWRLHAHPLRGCSYRSPRVRPASSGAGTPWRSCPPHLPPRAALRPRAAPKGRLSPSDTRQTGALARGNRVTGRCCPCATTTLPSTLAQVPAGCRKRALSDPQGAQGLAGTAKLTVRPPLGPGPT